jgi:hypothetical protein
MYDASEGYCHHCESEIPEGQRNCHNCEAAGTDALAAAFADGEEVFILIRHLREGLQPLVRDGLIDADRAYERARNTAVIVLGTFNVSIHRDLSREDVAELPVEQNPFASPILRVGNYGAANDLKRLALNLYNGSGKPDMAMIMRRDRKHRELAIAMLHHYAEHGEECPVFMATCRELA